MTPLHYAADGGNVDIISILLANGADATAVDEEGQTPLMIAEICEHEVLVNFICICYMSGYLMLLLHVVLLINVAKLIISLGRHRYTFKSWRKIGAHQIVVVVAVVAVAV
jgi:hypothetical protein